MSFVKFKKFARQSLPSLFAFNRKWTKKLKHTFAHDWIISLNISSIQVTIPLQVSSARFHSVVSFDEKIINFHPCQPMNWLVILKFHSICNTAWVNGIAILSVGYLFSLPQLVTTWLCLPTYINKLLYLIVLHVTHATVKNILIFECEIWQDLTKTMSPVIYKSVFR